MPAPTMICGSVGGGAPSLRSGFRLSHVACSFLQVPVVPMSVRAPEVPSMLYIEMSFEPEFVT